MRSLLRLGALVIAVLAVTAPAVAHEHRVVGDHEFTVGWLEEPAYAGFLNAVQFRVSDRQEKEPVEEADLEVAVIFGDRNASTQTDALTLEPAFGAPGEYHAAIIPTRPGKYTFHITGSLGKGKTIDQFFTSGEETFDDINEPSAVQFPAKDPSSSQLAQRLNRVDDTANGASTRGNIAFVIGVVGLVLGVAALARSRR